MQPGYIFRAMPSRTPTPLAALAALLITVAAAAQDNAAPLWRKAFEAAGFGSTAPLVSADDVEWMNTAAFPLTADDRARMADLMDRTAAVRQQFEAAARVRRSDWDLDMSKGFMLTLPHLADLRSAARMLRVQAMWELDEGRADAALATIGALGNMSMQPGQDDVLISSLVGQAVNGTFIDVANGAIDYGSIDAKTAQTMLESLGGLKGADPFGYGDALLGEKKALDASLASLKDDAGLRELLQVAGDGAAGSLTLEQARQEAAQLGPLYDRATRAFANPDPNEAMAEIRRLTQSAESGRFGALAKALFPDLMSVYRSKLSGQQSLALLIARLQAIAEGKEKPEELRNAALSLVRAGNAARATPADLQESIELVRVAPSALDPAARPRVDEAFARAQTTVAARLAEAAACKRCDFAIFKDREPLLDVGRLGGIRGAVRIALADGLRRSRAAGRADDAIRAAAIAYRVAYLLSTDAGLARSMVSHAIWRDATAAVTDARAIGPASADAKSALESATAAMPSGDPFGFRRSIDEDAMLLGGGDRLARERHPEAAKARAQVEKQRGPSAVLTAVVLETLVTGSSAPAADDLPLVSLVDLYPPAATAPIAAAAAARRDAAVHADDPVDAISWDLPIDEQKALLRKVDRLRGLPLVDLAQRMSNAAADYAAAFDAAKAVRVE